MRRAMGTQAQQGQYCVNESEIDFYCEWLLVRMFQPSYLESLMAKRRRGCAPFPVDHVIDVLSDAMKVENRGQEPPGRSRVTLAEHQPVDGAIPSPNHVQMLQAVQPM